MSGQRIGYPPSDLSLAGADARYLKLDASNDPLTGQLDIQYAYPAFRVRNTDFSQYSGAGFFLTNTASSMGNQAGVTHYMGINDAAATQGFYAIDKTNVAGGGTGHLMLFDYNANINYFYTTLSMSTNKITDVTSVNFPAVSAPAYSSGQLYFDSAEDALTFHSADANVSLNIGQEQWIKVTNSTGSSIANGVPVYISGATSGVSNITLAINTTQVGSQGIGLTTETIANGASGYVAISGKVRDINTSGFTAGATVYVGATAGSLTSTIPVNPAFISRVGTVLTSNATTGIIMVSPQAAPVFTAQAATGDLGTALSNIGARVAGTNYNLSTSGTISFTGTSAISNVQAVNLKLNVMTRTGTSFAPALTVANINMIDATAGAYLVTLPTTTTTGYWFTFKKIDATANVVTIKAGAAGTIDASNTYLLSTQYKYVTVYSTSTSDGWVITGNN